MAAPTPMDLLFPAFVFAIVGFFVGGPLLAGIGVVIGAAVRSAFPVTLDDDTSETEDE